MYLGETWLKRWVLITPYEIKSLAENAAMLTNTSPEEITRIYHELLSDITLPLDITQLVYKCADMGYTTDYCAIIVSVIMGFLLSRCIINKNCKIVVEPLETSNK